MEVAVAVRKITINFASEIKKHGLELELELIVT